MVFKIFVVFGVVLSLGTFMDGSPQFPTMQGFPYKPSFSSFQARTSNSRGFPPRSNSQAFPPRTSSQAFPPMTSSQAFPPRTSSQAFPPMTSSQAFPPRTSSQAFPPRSNSQAYSPRTSSQAYPAKTSLQAFPPRSTGFPSSNRFAVPSSPQAERVGNGKYAIVYTNRYATYSAALNACKSLPHPGASLFTVSNPADSAWLGRRINYEKDLVSGSSKFWVGLNSRNTAGNLRWLDQGAYSNNREVVQVSGYDDPEKVYAWAVPDGGSRLKYEFLTPTDEAEAFICQYRA